MPAKKSTVVETSIGKLPVDTAGSTITGVRIDVQKAYAGISALLQTHINDPHANTWKEIKAKIDYIYENLDYALVTLDKEMGFATEVQQQVHSGKKVLFKPNLVVPHVIDPLTHGPAPGDTTCTEWSFIAALMRWFHDRLNVEYSEMAIGDAASSTSSTAGFFNLHYANGRKITNEAVFEGKSGDFYGGWGFYFARKYLAECLPAGHKDDPMNGYEESVAGKYIPPGRAGNRLMMYDLNRISSPSRGRTVPVPQGANYKKVTLHKVIIGGDPKDPEDMKNYPGCVLVNVPKFKIHAQDLLTNAVKNLGIGLYPQEAPSDDHPRGTHWKYAYPFQKIPGMKTELPHMPLVAKMDGKNGLLPARDKKGNYILTRTMGFQGTQADIIRATQNQGVYMLHVVDAIEAINISHTGSGMGVRVNEGYVWASLDCVALDNFSARYCFKTVPMAEARKLRQKNGWSTEFVHKVPVAKVEGTNIVTTEDYDSPLFRYSLYKYCEERGIGKQDYHISGWDTLTKAPLASIAGHLGKLEDGKFTELIEKELWYNPTTMLWDMQKTVLSYAQAVDKLTGTTLYKDLMDAYDEDGDGVIEYQEAGKRGHWSPIMRAGAYSIHLRGVEKYGYLRGTFLSRAFGLKYGNKSWNAEGHDFAREFRWQVLTGVAFQMSRLQADMPDMFVPTMTFGNGKWPSWQLVNFLANGNTIYGLGYPMRADLLSLYGYAFQYADKTQNDGTYTGGTSPESDADSVNKYIRVVKDGAEPLDFTLYVPAGYGRMGMQEIPNVVETDNPAKVFTARFNGGKEVW
ncbi:MAG: DUF362 domain-containing protein [Dehalococcoidia bacterium]|nr:DUF362 domain-containing protein [Dehalococcoidia bacterium]